MICGIVAESERMNRKRFPNKKFRRFINITQLMIFSNNMEYDTECDLVEFLALMKLIDILKIRLSERQQTDHGQKDIAVFYLRL